MTENEGAPDGARRLRAEFAAASRKLTLKVSLSAGTLPLLMLAIFSLTVFRFAARQYLVYILAIGVLVIPFVVVCVLIYHNLQRRLYRRLRSWFDKARDPASQSDRDLAVRLQGELYRSAFMHGALVSLTILLSLALGVLIFGRFADFTPNLTLSYIAFGLVLGVTEWFLTVFLSHREMRPVMETLLASCKGFGYHSATGLGKRLASLAAVLIIFTLGTTWVAASYLSGQDLKGELEKRGADNVRLLAQRLSAAIREEVPPSGMEAIVEESAVTTREDLRVMDADGSVFFRHDGISLGEDAWQELVGEAAPEGSEAASFIRAKGGHEYLVTAAALPDLPGWKVLRAGRTGVSFHAMWRLTPTMVLLAAFSVLVAAFMVLILYHNFADPLKRLVGICRVVGSGDLDVEVPVDSLDDVGELTSSYSDMLASLRRISQGLLETSGEVSEGAENIVAVSEEIMAAIEELNALVQDLSGQIEDEVEHIVKVEEIMAGVAETISLSHAQAAQSQEISQDAERVVLEGRESAREAVQKIGDFKETLDVTMDAILSLGESSRQIGTIVDMITRIADQTNLLALNAAIEAARVPEHGKGFAVVAGEVKKLAQEAGASAQKISDLVRAIQKDVETAKSLMEKGTMGMYVGMETVDRTDRALLSVSEAVSRMSRLAESIAQASSRELDLSERLTASLEAMRSKVESTAEAYEEINASSEQQTQSTTELTATAEKLAEVAHYLLDLVSQFKAGRR
ncbi:MAG: methyl-accepting chemotaxis protein [Actinobacteria bacterium]|nr:methyl-accepting chemotaxis protein [Actinomycetota bacterium]